MHKTYLHVSKLLLCGKQHDTVLANDLFKALEENTRFVDWLNRYVFDQDLFPEDKGYFKINCLTEIRVYLTLPFALSICNLYPSVSAIELGSFLVGYMQDNEEGENNLPIIRLLMGDRWVCTVSAKDFVKKTNIDWNYTEWIDSYVIHTKRWELGRDYLAIDSPLGLDHYLTLDCAWELCHGIATNEASQLRDFLEDQIFYRAGSYRSVKMEKVKPAKMVKVKPEEPAGLIQNIGIKGTVLPVVEASALWVAVDGPGPLGHWFDKQILHNKAMIEGVHYFTHNWLPVQPPTKLGGNRCYYTVDLITAWRIALEANSQPGAVPSSFFYRRIIAEGLSISKPAILQKVMGL